MLPNIFGFLRRWVLMWLIIKKKSKCRSGDGKENSQGSPGFELSAKSYRQEFKKWQNKRNWINGGRYLQSFLCKCSRNYRKWVRKTGLGGDIWERRRKRRKLAKSNWCLQERINGYKALLKANGISFKNEWLCLVSCEHISKNVAEEMKKLLYSVVKVDAFLFATNSLAIESLKIINQKKIKLLKTWPLNHLRKVMLLIFFLPFLM